MSNREHRPDADASAGNATRNAAGAAGWLPGRAAEAYAALGYPVLPIWPPRSGPDSGGGCSCPRGASCPWPGKHPLGRLVPHGLKDATTDLVAVRGWWQQRPDANVALRTGPGSLDVCDIDGPEGVQALRAILRNAGPAARSGPLARTGGGGWHLAVRPSGRGNRAGFLPGVDWRGRGGCVLVWPSLHASGQRYRWVRPLPPPGELPEVPAPLRAALDPPPLPATSPPGGARAGRGAIWAASRYGAAALQDECAKLPATPPGRRGVKGRNHALNRTAFKLARLVVAGALTEAEITAALTAAAAAAGLGQLEAAAAIRSGLRDGQDPAKHRALHGNQTRIRTRQAGER
jgi:hypothetical protein